MECYGFLKCNALFVEIVKKDLNLLDRNKKNSMSFEFKLPYVIIIKSGFKRNTFAEIKALQKRVILCKSNFYNPNI